MPRRCPVDRPTPILVNYPSSWIDEIDDLVEQFCTTRSALMREWVRAGIDNITGAQI